VDERRLQHPRPARRHLGYPPDYRRIAVRGQKAANYRHVNAGLRVARTIGP
jgi:hypothetical protein